MLEFSINPTFAPLLTSTKRYVILMGGRAAGRSTFASQKLVLNLVTRSNYRAAIMRNNYVDIRDSIFREVADRIEEELEKRTKEFEDKWLAGEITYEKKEAEIKALSLSKIKVSRPNYFEFKKGARTNMIVSKAFNSTVGSAKLKSLANFGSVYIEEADEVDEEQFRQLDDSIRKKGEVCQVHLLLNPPHKDHWIIRRWFNLVDSPYEGFFLPVLKDEAKETVDFVWTNYRDNEANLNPATVANYEQYLETDPQHFFTMIQGYVSEGRRGRIFKDWEPISQKAFRELPYESVYGLDFGFTNDPTALIEVKRHNNTIWVNEMLYERRLTNKIIARKFEELGLTANDLIIADSAEPKSIHELNLEGFYVLAAAKGADSVRAGLDTIRSMKVFYTENSDNLVDEYRNYVWRQDRDKRLINVPNQTNDHLIDAMRYAIDAKRSMIECSGAVYDIINF